MSTINKVHGKKYRICKDAVQKIWDEISFITDSRDVTFTDNMTAEEKVGAIKGLVTSHQSETGYVMDASVTAPAPKVFTRTLRVGDTGEINPPITDPCVTSTAKVQIYTDQWGYTPKSVVVTGNTLSITFPAPKVLTTVKVEISEFV